VEPNTVFGFTFSKGKVEPNTVLGFTFSKGKVELTIVFFGSTFSKGGKGGGLRGNLGSPKKSVVF